MCSLEMCLLTVNLLLKGALLSSPTSRRPDLVLYAKALTKTQYVGVETSIRQDVSPLQEPHHERPIGG